MKTALFVNEFI